MTLSVAVVTQDEPFHMPRFFDAFFEELDADVSVEWVTVLPLLDESFGASVRRAYRLYGPANFLHRSVEYVGRRAADGLNLVDYSVASVAESQGVPVEHRESVNDGIYAGRVESNGVDVVLSVSAPEIFDTEVLDAPTWGCLNVHTSALPEYRGLLPTFWAMYHGEDSVGATVHTMAPEVDRGKAVRRTSVPVESDDSLDDVIARGKRRGGELAAAALADVAHDRVTLDPIDGEGSYFSFPTAAERRTFQRRGGELL